MEDNRFAVFYKGEPALLLNDHLASQNHLSDADIEKIKALHVERLIIEEQLGKCKTPMGFRLLSKIWTNIQYDLQDAWKFHRDARFHKSFEIPCCICPKLDNYELVGHTLNRWVNSNCQLHRSWYRE